MTFPPRRWAALFLAAALPTLMLGPRSVRGEEVVETADDGTLLARYETDEQGRKDGPYVRYHRNGRVAVKATYKADLRHGREQTWDETGVLRAMHTYRNGVLSGAHRTYDEKGRLRLDQAYRGGVLHGSYKSYHPNRRLHVVTSYRKGKLQGRYHERTPDGATRVRTTYVEGRLHGTYEAFEGKTCVTKQVWKEGEPLDVDGIVPFPRTKKAIAEELARILEGAGPLPSADLEADRALALRQLKAYRFLAGVPYEDIVLDAACNAYAQAGSEICAALGDITHTPENPGWPEDRYAFAAIGAAESNLHAGSRACTSVRSYIDDSDPSNIAKVGHRCWCLNPEMLKTGFGHVRGFTAMWATDASRAKVPDRAMVSLPPQGYVPGPWIGSRWAWSVALAPKHFDAPAKDAVVPRVEPIGEDFLPDGDALELDYTNVQTRSGGIPFVVIFRPAGISTGAGKRYRVTIEGLTHKGEPRALRYFVEFFDVPYEKPRLPRSDSDR